MTKKRGQGKVVRLVPKDERVTRKQKLKNAVRYFYDLQQLRIASSHRARGVVSKMTQIQLDETDQMFFEKSGKGLNALEKESLREVERLLEGIPIYEGFLKEQRGIGPTMASVLISEINIENCETPSQLWAWCGLATVGHVDCPDCDGTGREGGRKRESLEGLPLCGTCAGTGVKTRATAQRRVKGQRANYNPWLKAKLVKVMADCLVKANSPWKELYDNYKHRKEHTLMQVCMACSGSGKISGLDEEAERERTEKKPRKLIKCPNCEGSGGPAPWGKSKAHRHQAALRFMVKQFMLELWKEWRTLEELPLRPSYAVEFLGRVHHG